MTLTGIDLVRSQRLIVQLLGLVVPVVHVQLPGLFNGLVDILCLVLLAQAFLHEDRVHDLIELALWATVVAGLRYNINDPIHKRVTPAWTHSHCEWVDTGHEVRQIQDAAENERDKHDTTNDFLELIKEVVHDYIMI